MRPFRHEQLYRTLTALGMAASFFLLAFHVVAGWIGLPAAVFSFGTAWFGHRRRRQREAAVAAPDG